jgi:release factor glutamine methyltransferase
MSAVAEPDALLAACPTIHAALETGAEALREAGIDTAAADAEWLLASVLRVPRGALRLASRRTLEPAETGRYVARLRRRISREPLQHVLGTAPFRHITLRVGPDALVPRPETELLAEWALELLPPTAASPLVVDVGTVARDNVAALGLTGRVTVDVSDLFSALGPIRADVVVCNPPYLATRVIPTLSPEVSRHDPRVAMDGGPDGLAVIRRVVAETPAWLAPGGALALETAGDAQVHDVVGLMQAAGFISVATRRDLAGVERFVAGRRP